MYPSITDHHLICQLYFLPSELGGRSSPCFSNYRGQFFYHYNYEESSDWLASYTSEHEPVEAGQTVNAKIHLGGSIVDIAQERGMPSGKQIAIREGSRIIAVGVILESRYDYLNKA